MSAFSDIKASARQDAFARRKAAHSQATAQADHYLRQFLAEHRGRAVAGYMPIRTEINPLRAMAEASASATVGVPVIEAAGQPLWFSRWSPEAEMVPGPFGAQIPALGEEMIPEIVIVPLVAFDRFGNRLGYGGGFYDRTLERLRARGGVKAVGFAYSAQEAQQLPLEPTDQPLDLIITERGIFKSENREDSTRQ